MEEPIEVIEEPIVNPYDEQILNALLDLNDKLYWLYTTNWIIICFLFFILFFVALKAGK